VINLTAKFKLTVTGDAPVEEFEFDTFEALQAKAAELGILNPTPEVPPGDEGAPEIPPV
jgi:hypothetical protein